MPANLNALIRYKQIDQCLRNPYVDCTIQRLQEVCSEALAEYRGRYKRISERTIRDDLRVMRSEMLGFNAPIDQKDGRYFYTDPDYSIFKTPITEMNLLREVFRMLMQERENIRGPEVDELLKKIAGITGDELPGLQERMKRKSAKISLENLISEESLGKSAFDDFLLKLHQHVSGSEEEKEEAKEKEFKREPLKPAGKAKKKKSIKRGRIKQVDKLEGIKGLREEKQMMPPPSEKEKELYAFGIKEDFLLWAEVLKAI